ncbi:MAG: precorrin-6y C5,15-methyltransferase (decarboxylating) subunit CbiE, partial [Lentisphaeria bacterium]
MKHNLTIVSCGLGPQYLTDVHRQAIESADILAGGKRLLAWFPQSQAERVFIGKNAGQTVDELIKEAERRKVVVLASGDAFFYGIGRLFTTKLATGDYCILPNITAAQAAFAKLGVAWSDASFFSVHGRENTLPWRKILQSSIAVIYCDNIRTAPIVAQQLVENYPGCSERNAVILQDVGGENEQIKQGNLASLVDVSHLSPEMLLLMPPSGADDTAAVCPAMSLGLPDDVYRHERNLITHPEVRAVALAKLRLRPNGVLWDIGAGSGSLGIEATGICANLRVYCFEKKDERVAEIGQNAVVHGCDTLEVVSGDFLTAGDDFPTPDSVFVGGGGRDIEQIIECSMTALQKGGRLVATAVLTDSQERLRKVCPQKRVETLEIAVRRTQ